MTSSDPLLQLSESAWLALSTDARTDSLHRLFDMAAQRRPDSAAALGKLRSFLSAFPQASKKKTTSQKEQLFTNWVLYLSDEKAFQTHLNFLRIFRSCISEKQLPDLRIFPYARKIYCLSFAGVRPGKLELHESLAGMGEADICAVCDAILRKRYAAIRPVIRKVQGARQCMETARYFQQIRPQKKITEKTKGRYFDLDSVFDSVNGQFFEGKIARPRLTWSSRPAKRQMGSYNMQDDILTINCALDRKDVPSYVIDFLMYHEMLHKALGVKISKGRQLAHTAEFRRYEKQHPFYDAAETYLKNFAKTLR